MAAAGHGCLQSLLLSAERPAPLSRPPGPQVCVLPCTEGCVMLVDSFEQLWPPRQSAEDFLLYRCAWLGLSGV